MKLVLVALVLVVSAGGLAVACDQPSDYTINMKRKDDAVDVRTEKDRTVFSVKSPSGISQAVIERRGETWPRSVVLRLHLMGLEIFRASNGKITLAAAVSVQEGKPKVRQWEDGREDALLDEKSPCWMDIRMLTVDGKPATKIPLKDGYFEIALPRAFFEHNPKAITLAWIDFYRQ
jgi:hypothetical protein